MRVTFQQWHPAKVVDINLGNSYDVSRQASGPSQKHVNDELSEDHIEIMCNFSPSSLIILRVTMISGMVLVLTGCTDEDSMGSSNPAETVTESSANAKTIKTQEEQTPATEQSNESLKPATLPFCISKETTYVTEPVTEDGSVNYAAYLNRMMSSGITPENNACVLYWQAIGDGEEVLDSSQYFQNLKRELGTNPFKSGGPYLIGLAQFAKQNSVSEESLQLEVNQVISSPWKSADYPSIKKLLTVNEKPLFTAIKATQMNRYYLPVVIDGKHDHLMEARLPSVQKARYIASLLEARAMLALGENRPTDAIRDLLAIHRLARHIAQGWSLIEMMVGVAVESIAHEGDRQLAISPSISADQLKNYLRGLSQLEELINFDRSSLGDRLLMLDAVQQLIPESGDIPDTLIKFEGIDSSSPHGKSAIAQFQKGVDWNQVLIGINNFYDLRDEALYVTSSQSQNKAIESHISEFIQNSRALSSPEKFDLQNLDTPKKRAILIKDFLLMEMYPAFGRFYQAAVLGQIKTLLSQQGMAVSAYQKEQGKLPESLSDLVPNYLRKLPDDPFTGNSFVYRVDSKGAVIYSIGENLKDDGGKPFKRLNGDHDRVFRVRMSSN